MIQSREEYDRKTAELCAVEDKLLAIRKLGQRITFEQQQYYVRLKAEIVAYNAEREPAHA